MKVMKQREQESVTFWKKREPVRRGERARVKSCFVSTKVTAVSRIWWVEAAMR